MRFVRFFKEGKAGLALEARDEQHGLAATRHHPAGAVPKFSIAHSGLHRVGSAPKTTSNTRTFRLTRMLGERLRNIPKAVIAKVEGIPVAAAARSPSPRHGPCW